MKRILPLLLCLAPLACGGETEEDPVPHEYTGMTGEKADLEFDVVTFKTASGEVKEVHLNGLAVAAVPGANKVSADQWEVVQRRGVRFSTLLEQAGLSADDAIPVNCIARDGWDPLRTRLQNDTTKLPRFDFLRDHGYVYVGSPGDKDPLYPEMEGKSLMVDYDMDGDASVPAYLGGNLSGLGQFRWKMIEKVDDAKRGLIELDPAVD